MKKFIVVLCLFLFANPAHADEKSDVASVLDSFHVAAANAQAQTYFDLFTADAVFIGTDVGEYWTVEEFKSYAMPGFSEGKGWTYVPRNRDIHISDSGEVAWFHEVLDSESYGTTRGTGVLLFDEGKGWKIAQYHLTVPVPNDLIGEVTDRIKSYENQAEEHSQD